MKRKGQFFYLKKYMILTGMLEIPGVAWPMNNALTAVNWISQFYLAIAGFIFCLTDSSPFFSKIESIVISTANTHLFLKVIVLPLRRKKLVKWMDLLEEMSEESKVYGSMAKVHTKDLLFSKRTIEIVLISFVILHAGSIAISVTNHFFGHDALPLQLYIPFQIEGNFYLACVYCVGICIFPVFNLATVMGILTTFIVNTSTQMTFLAKRLEDLGKDMTDADVKSCIAQHQKVLRIVNHLNDLMSFLLFFEYLLTSLITGLSGYRCFVAEEETYTRVLGGTIFVISIAVPAVNCIGGEIIKNRSEKIFISAYDNNWYLLNLSDKKMLKTLLLLASEPQTIKFKNLIVFNMMLFGVILKGAYSFITALQTVSN